jgi:uncharacterized phage infection (PIP) family protein YhgE
MLLDFSVFELSLMATGAALVVAFVMWYVLPAWCLAGDLKQLLSALLALPDAADPASLPVKSDTLRHLWKSYLETLLAETSIDENGMEIAGRYRSTVPASIHFNSNAIADARIAAEFFRHLPGLLTGIGIIGTFHGLITGLQGALQTTPLAAQPLMESVSHAFILSASAIGAAMLITLIEKVLYAHLHGLTDQIASQIDRRFQASLGEEYLEKLVKSSEAAVTNSQQLKDSLVRDLRDILERLAEKQIEASVRQGAVLSASLQQPIEAMTRGIEQLGATTGSAIGAGFQDQMAAFADKLDHLLGGQVNQARELQGHTLAALEKATAAFEGMAHTVGTAGEDATRVMAERVEAAIKAMAGRQEEMAEAMRGLLDDMRLRAKADQEGTQEHFMGLLKVLGERVEGTIGQLHKQAEDANTAARHRQQELSEEAQSLTKQLANAVREQTQALEQAASAMRAAVADMGASATRSLAAAGESADRMTAAASEFTRTGAQLTDVYQGAQGVSRRLTETSEVLRATSGDIAQIAADYRGARSDFAETVETLRQTIATAQRDASMTTAMVQTIHQAAEKLRTAQGEADAYLQQLNVIFAQAYQHFREQMLETVRGTNTEFHKHLTTSTGQLADVVGLLGDELERIGSAVRMQ